jgi:hypothetical protein
MLKIKKSRRCRNRNTRKEKWQIPVPVQIMQGGTRVILYDGNKRGRLARDDDNSVVSEMLLQNIESVSKVSSSSVCSMILKGDLNPESNVKLQSQVYERGNVMNDKGRLLPVTLPEYTQKVSVRHEGHINIKSSGDIFNTVCMKITLINPAGRNELKIPWQESKDTTIMKMVSTQEECETEFKAQRSMYAHLLCGENPRELIPDALASIVMTPEEFAWYMRRHAESLPIVKWIYKSASVHTLNIHIMFMDFLEGYKSLYEFSIDKSDEIKLNAGLEAGYVLVMIVLMTMGLPWDLHNDNILIDSKTHKAKCIDFGRMQFLNIDPEFKHLKECLTKFQSSNPHHCRNFFRTEHAEIELKFVVLINNVVRYSNEKYDFHSLNQDEQFKRVYEIFVLVAFTDIITNYFHDNALDLQCLDLLITLFDFPDMKVESFLTTFPSTYEELPGELKTKLRFKYVVDSIKQSIGPCKNPKLRHAESFRPLTQADEARFVKAKAAAESKAAAQAAEAKAAAEAAEANYKLAEKHRWGKEGVTKDLAEAEAYYLDAAKDGHKEAQYRLGQMYETRADRADLAIDKDRNYRKAVEYYTLAANQGNSNAQYTLGSMFYLGEVVDKNLAEAERLLSLALAKDQRHVNAKALLKKLEKMKMDGGSRKTKVNKPKYRIRSRRRHRVKSKSKSKSKSKRRQKK